MRYGEFLQNFEDSINTRTLRAAGAVAIGPSGNLQGGVRCFSLVLEKVLNHQWKDATVLKMTIGAIRINFLAKKQKLIKGLKFGDDRTMQIILLDQE